MATVNTKPIYSKVGDCQWIAGSTIANTVMDGTGTTTTVFTADATNGGYVQRVLLRALGTNVATANRIWINNGTASSVATNNTLVADTSLPATTASNSAALAPVDVPLNLALPPGYKLIQAFGTAVAAGWQATAIGGKY